MLKKIMEGIPPTFRERIDIWIDEIMSEYPYENHKDAFTHRALELLFPLLDSDTIYELVDFPNREVLNIDARYENEVDAIYYLFKAELAGEETDIGIDSANVILDVSQQLLDSKGNHQADELSAEINAAIDNGYELRFVIIVTAKAVAELDQALQDGVEALDIPRVSGEVFDLSDLYAAYLQEIGPKGVTETIKFPFHGSVIECTWLQPHALVANLDVAAFGHAIQDFIPSIFDVNVRNPLGEKNKINRNIEETLQGEGEHFWHYNNGMTILCTKVVYDKDALVIIATAPVIVNGCQTADTIVRNRDQLQNETMDLLVRFIELPAEDPKRDELAVSIARYTNSQNPVRAPDFRSNDIVQIALQEDFQHLEPSWFYERKRGEWGTVEDEKRILYQTASGSHRRISMVEVAQQWYAFSGHPAEAISSRSSLFEHEGTYNTIFPGTRIAHEYLVPHLLFGQASDHLKIKLRQARKAKETDDLEERSDLAKYYRLSKAKNLAAAHLVAMIAELLRRRYGQFSYEVAKHLLSSAQNGDLFSRTFTLIERSFLDYMDLRPEESMHSVLRDSKTLDKLIRKLDEQLSWIVNSMGIDPLQRFPDLNGG